MLPGIDGATVIRRIRLDAALRGLPCLLLTGSEERDAELRALDAGADAFVRKDEDIEVILARLSAMLRSAGAQSRRRRARQACSARRRSSPSTTADLPARARRRAARGGLRRGPRALRRGGAELLAVQPVDCILLDLLMPGMGGQETCRRIKSAPVMRDIPLIMLTALEDRDAMIEGLSAGADDYIAKSSDFEVLSARVRAQIRRKQFEDENRRIREQLLRARARGGEARAARELAETRAALVGELERKNEELEAFSYSVSHDLRAPLRSIDGFSLALLEDYGDKLDDDGKQYLTYVRESAQQMAQLIDDMLALSRVTRGEFERATVDVTCDRPQASARSLPALAPDRKVELVVADGLDRRRRRRLLGDRARESARQCLEVHRQARAGAHRGRHQPTASCAPSSCATTAPASTWPTPGQAVRRVPAPARRAANSRHRHRARDRAAHHPPPRRAIWAEGVVGRGATFFFTLGDRARVAAAETELGSSRNTD